MLRRTAAYRGTARSPVLEPRQSEPWSKRGTMSPKHREKRDSLDLWGVLETLASSARNSDAPRCEGPAGSPWRDLDGKGRVANNLAAVRGNPALCRPAQLQLVCRSSLPSRSEPSSFRRFFSAAHASLKTIERRARRSPLPSVRHVGFGLLESTDRIRRLLTSSQATGFDNPSSVGSVRRLVDLLSSPRYLHPSARHNRRRDCTQAHGRGRRACHASRHGVR